CREDNEQCGTLFIGGKGLSKFEGRSLHASRPSRLCAQAQSGDDRPFHSGPIESRVKHLLGSVVRAMISPGGSIVASLENVNGFLAMYTPLDDLIRTTFKKEGVVPEFAKSANHENLTEQSRLGIFLSKEIFQGEMIRIHNAFVHDEDCTDSKVACIVHKLKGKIPVVRNKMHKAFPLPVIEFPLAEQLPTAKKWGIFLEKTGHRSGYLRKVCYEMSIEADMTEKAMDTLGGGGMRIDPSLMLNRWFEIFMLVEKDYPLRKGLALVMICYKLQVENFLQMANDLVLKIYKIANSPRQQAKHSSRNEDGNSASVPTASTNVPTASTSVATISQDTACTYIASQSSGSQIKFEDINQIDEDDMEEMDIKWNMALLSMRADKFWKKTGKKISIQGSDMAGFDKSKAPKALMAIDRVGWDWSYMVNEEEDHALVADEIVPIEFALMANTSAESKVFDNSLCLKDCKKNNDSLNKSRLVEYKEREVKYIKKIRTLEFYNESNKECIEALKKKLETLKQEKERVDGKLAGLLTASKDLDNLIESQRLDKNKEGLGYTTVPPPPAQLYLSPKKDLSWTGLSECTDDTVTDYSRPSPTVESTLKDDQNKNLFVSETVASPITPKPFIKFVKPKDSQYESKTDKKETPKKPPVKYAEQYIKLNKKHNIMLRTPRQHNMYSIDLNNIVPHRDLTCLVAKTSADECMLWHRRLGKFEEKGDKGYFNGYSMSSKAFRVFNKRTRRVEENLHVEFLENKDIEKGYGPNWLFDIDSLTKSINHVLVDAVETPIPTVSSPVPTAYSTDSQEPSSDARIISKRVVNQEETPSLDNILSLTNRFKDILGGATNSDESNGEEADISNMETAITSTPTPTLRIHKDHPKSQIIGPVDTPIQTRNKSKEVGEQSFIATIHQKTDPTLLQFYLFLCFLSQVEPKKIFDALQDPSWVEAMQEDLLQFKIQNVWTLVECPKGVRPIGTKWVLKNKKDERGIVIRNKARLVAQGHTREEGIDYDEVFAPVARIEAIRLFLAYASFMGFTVYQMDVKSAFLYGTIDKEVYVMQPPRFQDPEFPAKVYKVEKAMYGLHQAPRAWYGTLSKYLLKNSFQRGKIDQNLFIKRQREDFILVQVYADDIIFGSSNPQLCKEFEALMHEKFQMSVMGELNFFLGLQVLQKEYDIFLSQDKYVGDILKKFRYLDVRPDIMFAVYACARHQVTPKECHLHVVKRIFRYLKCHPKLRLWYPKESPFDLVAYSDSDYGGATQDRKSTTGGSASCYGQVLWIQNQLLDYGYNFMNTYIYIDNNSAICIVKNPVYHSKTKHIEIRHHFIRDIFEKKIISVDHIHTDENVADLLTKPFDAGRFQYLDVEHAMRCFVKGILNIYIRFLRLIPLGKHNVNFHPMVDFIEASPLRIETTEEGTKILAIVDGIVRTVSESSLRRNLKLRDKEGISSLPDTELFENLTLMGYNISPNQKFTFQKGQFSHQWKYLIHTIMIVPLFDTMLVQQGEDSGTPTEPHHTPSPKAPSPSHTTHTSPLLPPVTTTSIPTVTPTETTPIRQYTRRARIAQSSALPTDRATIANSSTLPYDSAPRVTSLAAVKGSMKQTIPKLTALCTSLQRKLSELTNKFQAQEVEINRLKARVKLLEEREGLASKSSEDDAPIKGRSIDEGEAAIERVSDDTEEMATVLTLMYAATVLASRVVDVPTGSGSISTASIIAEGSVPTGSEEVPTASLVFATATVVTPVIRRKGKEVMESAKKQKTSEEVPEEAMSPEEVTKEKVKEMMQLVPIEEVYAKALQVKHPIIDWKHLDREDLNQLWRLVKETLSNRPPTSDKEMELWVELNMMYELDKEDQLWTHTQYFIHAPVNWKLYDSCGVHHVTSKDKEIFMLVEKDYPLRKGLALVMICYKLQVENFSQMANDLVLKIY
nr:hypothetical protein [Tanacetum cinerariifolium]